MRYTLPLILATTLMTGCASATKKYEISQEWDQAKLAPVAIYRTKTMFHSGNPERPFFYIDGMEVGQLGTGMDVTTKVTAGRHVITVRDSILFMPGRESGRIEYEFEAGKTYYLRYSKEFSGVTTAGNTTVVTDSSNFSLADESSYLERK